MFSGTEADLQELCESWLSGMSMPFLSQWETPAKSRTDLVLFNSHADQRPWCVIELKRALSVEKTKLSELADHFEQCLKYHSQTGLPVFLGPFFVPTMGLMNYMQGGVQIEYAVAAFAALAGRANVGMCFINATPGAEHNMKQWHGFHMTLRQQTVARYHKYESDHVWPSGNAPLVSFGGAASTCVRRAE